MQNEKPNSNDHWVPQFYLRRWTSGKHKKLVAIWREKGRERHSCCSTRAVLSENHLYSVYGAAGGFIHGEEAVFKEIDNDAAPVLRILADGDWRSIPNTLAKPFYRFIHTLAPRNRRMRDRFIESDSGWQQAIIGELRRSGMPPVEVEALLSSIALSPQDRAALQILLIAQYDQSWGEFFGDIPFFIYEIPEGLDAEFFTSDNPLRSEPSIDHPEAVHIFPVSPSRCLVASHNPGSVASLCGTPPAIFVSYVNLLTLANSETCIARDRRYEPIIFNYLGCAVNRGYLKSAVDLIFKRSLRIGAADSVPSAFAQATDEERQGPYNRRAQAFRAGIDGCPWGRLAPAAPPDGQCEALICETRDWYLDASTLRESYELGRSLRFIFASLDRLGMPARYAMKLKKALRAHSVRAARENRLATGIQSYAFDDLLVKSTSVVEEVLKAQEIDSLVYMPEARSFVSDGFEEPL